MEAQKMKLGEKVGALFSRRLAEKQWVMNHREQIQQYAKMAEALPEEERTKVYAKIEHDMQESTRNKVWINRAAAGITLAAATFVGVLIGSDKFQNIVKNWHIGSKNFGEGLANWGAESKRSILVRGAKAKEGLQKLWEKRPGFLGGVKKTETAPAQPVEEVVKVVSETPAA